MTGRRELHRRLFAYSGVCAVCGRSPAAVPGAGPARRLQPFHSCVLASRTLPQPCIHRGRTGRTRDERRSRISKTT
jgi:hypothetical protein